MAMSSAATPSPTRRPERKKSARTFTRPTWSEAASEPTKCEQAVGQRITENHPGECREDYCKVEGALGADEEAHQHGTGEPRERIVHQLDGELRIAIVQRFGHEDAALEPCEEGHRQTRHEECVGRGRLKSSESRTEKEPSGGEYERGDDRHPKLLLEHIEVIELGAQTLQEQEVGFGDEFSVADDALTALHHYRHRLHFFGGHAAPGLGFRGIDGERRLEGALRDTDDRPP